MGISLATVGALEKRPVRRTELSAIAGLIGLAERIAALAMFVVLLPVIAIVAAATAILSGRSPFIALARAGHRGKRIWLIKVRTMWGADDRPGDGGLVIERIENAAVPPSKAENDPRVTSAFAAFCRRYSIDELPQLWHVIRGEMALVGPRPLTYDELVAYYGYDAAEVLSVRPGLTGLWQVKGRSRLTYAERLTYDLYLVRHWSLRLYFFVLAATVPAVLSGRDAS